METLQQLYSNNVQEITSDKSATFKSLTNRFHTHTVSELFDLVRQDRIRTLTEQVKAALGFEVAFPPISSQKQLQNGSIEDQVMEDAAQMGTDELKSTKSLLDQVMQHSKAEMFLKVSLIPNYDNKFTLDGIKKMVYQDHSISTPKQLQKTLITMCLEVQWATDDTEMVNAATEILSHIDNVFSS